MGVYFKVDDNQFFFAHMDARTPEIWPKMIVTKAAGLEIAEQVKRRLFDFMLHDEWDVRNPKFGENLTMQCPSVHSRTLEGETYYTPGYYIIRAVKEFFQFCAELLEKEKGGKSARLKQIVNHTRVDGKHVNGNHHIMIVDPSKDDPPIRLGEVCDSKKGAEEKDLGDYKPIKITIRESICHFGVLEDDRTHLPRKFLLPKDHIDRQKNQWLIECVREEHKNFGGKPNSETNKLLKIVEDTCLQSGAQVQPKS